MEAKKDSDPNAVAFGCSHGGEQSNGNPARSHGTPLSSVLVAWLMYFSTWYFLSDMTLKLVRLITSQ